MGVTLTHEGVAFVTERHLATLTTLRADGTPHVCPVGFTYDADGAAGAGVVRVITGGASQKAANLRRDGRLSLCQVDGARWLTLEGAGTVLDDPAEVAEAVALYTARYRPPRENPTRVVLLAQVTRVLGTPAFRLPRE